MPFLLKLLKNPAVLKWGAIALIMIALFSYGKIQYVRLEQAKVDLAVTRQAVATLETTLEAEKQKAVQRLADSESKQQKIQELNQLKLTLSEDYASTRFELDNILNTVIPGIETPEDAVEAKKIVQTAVNQSYGCIEAATKGLPCE